MPERLLDMGDPTDARFQFEILRSLAESVKLQTTALGELQKQTNAISERLARIESNRIHDDVAQLRIDVGKETARIEALMRDKDRRDGALGAWTWLQRTAPWGAVAGAGAAAVAGAAVAAGAWLASWLKS